jgi:hypothetical protein
MKILIASMAFPYPPNFGGAYDVYWRIRQLSALGHDIELVYCEKNKPTKDRIEHMSNYLSRQYFVKRKNKLIDFFSHLPLQVLSRKEIQNIEFKSKYDLLVVEGDYVSSILKNKTLEFQKNILRIHNDEKEYFYSLYKSESNLLKKVYFLFESIKFKYYSKKLYSSFDKLWFISNTELNKTTLIQNSVYLPPPFNLENVINSDSSVFINPIQRGAGVKIKSIDAIVNGLPLVTSSIGVEGLVITDNPPFLIANNAEDFFINVGFLLSDIKNRHTFIKNREYFLSVNNHFETLKNELQ